MKPTIAVLEERDLLDVARGIAKAHHVTLEEMLGRERGLAFSAARSDFYAHLVGLGWAPYAIARLVGRDHTTVAFALRNNPYVLMTPSRDALDRLGFLTFAEGCACAAGVSLAEMFGRGRRPEAVAARRAFYDYLRVAGWSTPRIAVLVGRKPETIDAALHPSPALDRLRAQQRREMAAPKADAGHKDRVAASLDRAVVEFAPLLEKLSNHPA